MLEERANPPALDDGEAAAWVLKVEEGHDEPAKGVGDALGAHVLPASNLAHTHHPAAPLQPSTPAPPLNVLPPHSSQAHLFAAHTASPGGTWAPSASPTPLAGSSWPSSTFNTQTAVSLSSLQGS